MRFVIVDSHGTLYYEQIRHLVTKGLEHDKSAGKEVGIHTHNNQHLSFANAIEGSFKESTGSMAR
ncbi:MAG: hypothetical protein M2R45_04218 [Verrucomicrobia subdivision 3 bacterium]|nr:hypothetical protein [Limisphaerales bacterium]MCS1417045.1 hypothetical protein [Limisphaerales bacterium]